MTQEEKDLLLKDLCARLPYNVCVKTKQDEQISFTWNELKNFTHNDEICKPYLRPMSSMTEEEFLALYSMCCEKAFQFREHPTYYRDFKTKKYVPNFIYSPNQLDYLISRHFDYRGLIPMGLALEAPEGMYK